MCQTIQNLGWNFVIITLADRNAGRLNERRGAREQWCAGEQSSHDGISRHTGMRRRIGQVGKRPVITEGLHLNAISRDLYILDTSLPNEDAVIRDAQVRQAG